MQQAASSWGRALAPCRDDVFTLHRPKDSNSQEMGLAGFRCFTQLGFPRRALTTADVGDARGGRHYVW